MSKKLPEGEGKRVPLNMRTTREVRDRLEAAAEASGRSLAQEVESRIESSFAQETVTTSFYEMFSEICGGSDYFTSALSYGNCLKKAKIAVNNMKPAGLEWFESDEKRKIFGKTVKQLMGDELFSFENLALELTYRAQREKNKSAQNQT